MQIWLNSSVRSYKIAFLFYSIFIAVLFYPYILYGEVIAPHRQIAELGIESAEGDGAYIENRKFSDYTSSYIPETDELIRGLRSGWLTLWSKANELGRPVSHLSGFSTTYTLSWLLNYFVNTPWYFITFLSLFTCFFAGIFILLYSHEVGLHPFAGLIAAICLAASPTFMYWLTFPMFAAVYCWSAAALWAVTRLSRSSAILPWGVLSFSIYSLLMAGYPQTVVYHVYLLIGYGLYLIYSMRLRGMTEIIRFLGRVSSALAVGVLLVIPVYRDIFLLFEESARISPDPSFFTYVLPNLKTLHDVLNFVVFSTVPEIFGNPVSPEFPFPYNGVSVTLPVIFLVIFCLLTSFKKTWGWWLAVFIIFIFTFSPSLYIMGIRYLGFNLSSATPLGTALLPFVVLVAYGADVLVAEVTSKKKLSWVLVAFICTVGVLGIGLIYAYRNGLPIHGEVVLAIGTVVALLAVQYRGFGPFVILLALALTLTFTSFPLMLRQPLDQIAITSPLVEKIRGNLPAGSRYAVDGSGVAVLPPNLNASLDIPSLHSYNSLSSSRYHILIEALGGEVKNYGRSNRFIKPDYKSPMFWMSNVGLILSAHEIIDPNLQYVGAVSGIYLYKVVSRMGESIQVLVPSEKVQSGKVDLSDPRQLKSDIPVKILDMGDLLEFKVVSEEESLLILSQKYHRDWHASVLSDGEWIPAQAVEVNGVFQGVMIPSKIEEVRLEFKPWVRFAWIAHAFWMLLMGIVLFVELKKRQTA